MLRDLAKIALRHPLHLLLIHRHDDVLGGSLSAIKKGSRPTIHRRYPILLMGSLLRLRHVRGTLRSSTTHHRSLLHSHLLKILLRIHLQFTTSHSEITIAGKIKEYVKDIFLSRWRFIESSRLFLKTKCSTKKGTSTEIGSRTRSDLSSRRERGVVLAPLPREGDLNSTKRLWPPENRCCFWQASGNPRAP